MDLTNPITLIIGGVLLLAILYFWNKRNANRQKERRNKNFRSRYYERKKNKKDELEN